MVIGRHFLWPSLMWPSLFVKKGRYSSSWKLYLKSYRTSLAIWDHTLLPATRHKWTHPSRAGWYSIYLPPRHGRLSWPSWLDSAPAGSRTSDLSITSPTLNHCAIKTTNVCGRHCIGSNKLCHTSRQQWQTALGEVRTCRTIRLWIANLAIMCDRRRCPWYLVAGSTHILGSRHGQANVIRRRSLFPCFL